MNVKHQLSKFLSTSLALLALLASGQVFAADGDHDESHHTLPHQHLSLMLGYAFERKRDTDEEAGAIGLDYVYRYHENWGIGGFVEGLGDDVIRDLSVGLLMMYYPVAGWSLFAGPGYEFTDKHNEILFRIGTGYDFTLPNKWTVGPKLSYDLIEGGKRTYVLGIALGREF